MLTGPQFGLYTRLWKGVLEVTPGADREAMHAQLGLPASRKDWTNDDLDEWKRACLAISDPANLKAQIDGLPGAGEAKRKRHVLAGCLAKLGKKPAYADGIARNMGLRLPIEQLTAPELEKIIVALRKQLRRGRSPVPDPSTSPTPASLSSDNDGDIPF